MFLQLIVRFAGIVEKGALKLMVKYYRENLKIAKWNTNTIFGIYSEALYVIKKWNKPAGFMEKQNIITVVRTIYMDFNLKLMSYPMKLLIICQLRILLLYWILKYFVKLAIGKAGFSRTI